MTRQVAGAIDLRTGRQRAGGEVEESAQAIMKIMQIAGAAEKKRREGQTLDRVARAIASGKTTIQAITDAAIQEPSFGTGFRGGLQKIAGAFQPQGGGVREDIQQSIIGSALQQALSKPQPFTLTAGARRFTGAGEPIAEQPAIPRGPLVTVQTGDIEKGTKGKIEQDIVELQTTLTELEAIDKQFNEEFFTYIGKGSAAVTAFFEKAKIPVGKARQKFLGNKTTFFADAKRVFLKFRKFITGVAGGIEEFREIAKATIDPESDSPTQFKAKMKSMRDNAVRTRNVLLAIRNSGLNADDPEIRKQVFTGISLGAIPLDVPGTVTLESLKGQPESDVLVTHPFRQGNVPTATSPKTGKKMIFKDGKWIPFEEK